MISPHLLKVVESHSTSIRTSRDEAIDIADTMGGEDAPLFVLEHDTKKKPKWCHIILASGPVLDTEEADTTTKPQGSQLLIVWWSEMAPDTSRVLDVVDWEKHAKNY